MGKIETWDWEELKRMSEIEEEQRERVEEKERDVGEQRGLGEEGKPRKLLGKDFTLRQAEVGKGEVMQGRKIVRGKRRGGKKRSDEKKRVKMKEEQAAFMASWTSLQPKKPTADRLETSGAGKG